MNGQTFGENYAAAYDLLYADKDYPAECDLVQSLIDRHAARPVLSILDLGCGTGGHAFPLAERGYEVVGVDRSEAMLAHARRKLGERGEGLARRLQFRAGDIRSLNVDRAFDAALMMFAALGYQASNDGVTRALRTARRHLTPGGVLIFDVWYGPAVLHIGPSERVKAIPVGHSQVLRLASPTLDIRHHLCRVVFHLWDWRGGQGIREAVEEHTMRFFFPMEIEGLLAAAQFELTHLSPFADLAAQPSLEDWNVIACARAV
jgi:SAM-dependent methyltransferase